MLIIKIDHIDTKPAQASFARLLYIVRFAADSAKLRFRRIAQNSKLCRDHDMLAMAAQRPPHELFIGVRAVDVGRVEKINPEVERAMNRGERQRYALGTQGLKGEKK
jgi:hypothetical protein